MTNAKLAQLINLAVAAPTTRRFGDHKAFIISVFETLGAQLGGMDLETFKSKLIELNRAGTIWLARADLPHIMKRSDVQGSEINYRDANGSLIASFHFVERMR